MPCPNPGRSRRGKCGDACVFVREGRRGIRLRPGAGGAQGAAARGFYPWTITKTEWSADDEAGFSRFVAAIGASDCSSSQSCVRGADNPYHASDPRWFDVDLDCAKWPYFLRAYYAWKNHLPFSYVDAISGGADLKYGKKGNLPVSRTSLIDHGHGINGPKALYELIDTVFSATYRTDANQHHGVPADFYSPGHRPGLDPRRHRDLRHQWPCRDRLQGR